MSIVKLRLNTEDKMDNFLRKQIETHGMRYGEEIEFLPFGDSPKKIKLLYKTMIFTTEEQGPRPWVYQVFARSGECFSIQLKLQERSRGRQFYIIQSLDGRPFKMNGNIVWEAYLLDGDQIQFGMNRIRMNKDKKKHEQRMKIPVGIKDSKLPILIEGETGVGKSRLARQLAEEIAPLSSLIHLNLSSFASSLLESELFGHIKGAFTGAIHNKKGALREAHNGVLFLDEIDSLPLDLQVKLLLFLDSGVVRPVGGGQEYKVNCRIIFASGSILKELVKSKKMRSDFYFRLSSGFKIHLPSLRCEKTMIQEFINHFEVENKVVFDTSLINFYVSYQWPGNFRQLKSHLELKQSMSRGGRIQYDLKDQELLELDFIDSTKEEFLSLDELKKNYILKVYYDHQCVVHLASEALQISASTLRNYLKRYDLNLSA